MVIELDTSISQKLTTGNIFQPKPDRRKRIKDLSDEDKIVYINKRLSTDLIHMG